MDVIDRRVITAEIFKTLAKGTESLEDWPEWRSCAAQYLECCISLYPDGQRRQDFDTFIHVVLFFNSPKENYGSSFFDRLTSEDIVAGFKILYAGCQEYKRAIGLCLSAKLKRFFDNPENLKTYEALEPRFAELVGAFKEPVNISRDNFNELVNHVRNLPEASRNRRGDIRLLIQLWQAAKETEDVFAEIMKLPDEDFAGIAFDVLQSLTGTADYHNTIVACLKNYADKKSAYDANHSAVDCVRLASVCSCLFQREEKRRNSIDTMRETAENVRIDSRLFLDALFKTTLSHDPLDAASTYFFDALYILLRQKTITEELMHQIQFLTAQCAKRDFFNRNKMHSLITQLLRDAESDTGMILRYTMYIQQVVWLAQLYPDTGTVKETVSLVSRYYVLRRTTGTRYYLTHIRILLRLLQSLISGPRERMRLVRDIQRFYEEDSLSCPAVSTQLQEVDIDEKAKENAVICRKVIEILKRIKDV